MSTGWKNVHVFISSTFNDMHGERDYLVKRVFPQLREWCERRKLRLVDIDLRWGVTEEDATRNKNVVRTCLKRIDDCRPFFVCFLGQRRGWAPKPDEVAPETFTDFPALKPHIGQASITELEILHALIKPFHGQQNSGEAYDPVKHAFFYLREPDYLDQMPAAPVQLRETYTNAASADPDGEDVALQRWREQEIPATKRPVHRYKAAWTPEATTPELALPLQCPSADPKNIERWRDAWKRAGITVTGLDVEDNPAEAAKARNLNARLTQGRLTDFVADTGESLADTMLVELQEAIEERYPDHVLTEQDNPLQQELDQQAAFLAINSEGFIERTGDFDALNTYLDDDSRQMFVLTAPGGMGKSMLLANWLNRRQEDMHRRDTALVYRFIGQSDASSTVPGLLRSMMLQLQDLGRIPKTKMATVEDPRDPNNKIEQEVPFDIPQDPTELHNTWQEQRQNLGEQGRTVVVIDALNQLESGMKNLHWLPFGGLPENVKIIVSFRADAPDAGECIERWGNNPNVKMEQVKPFEDLADRRNLVDAYLAQFLKELDKDHLEALIRSEGAHNPLFLKVVLSELRVHGAFGQLGEKIKHEFGTTPVSAFDAVLRRLETDPAYSDLPPAQAVPLIFGLLAHARRGLSDEELTDLLHENGDSTKPAQRYGTVPAFNDATLAAQAQGGTTAGNSGLTPAEGGTTEDGSVPGISTINGSRTEANSGLGKTGTGNASAATEGSENGACTRFAQTEENTTADGSVPGISELEPTDGSVLGISQTGTGNGSAATEGSENGACTRFAKNKTEDGNERGAKEGSEDNTSNQVAITRQAIRDTVYLFLRQLRPFLARRNDRYDFFYESFKTAALERYVTGAPRAIAMARTPQEWHTLIADYLNTRWREPWQHALEDLPWHQIRAENWGDLIGDADTPGTLTDLLFIQAKCKAGLVYELMTDYNEALAALPEFREENAYLQQRDAAMRDYNQALRDYAVVRYDWWQQKEQGNILPEPDYPTMPEILEKTDGRKIPEEESERAARLRHFANYLSKNDGLFLNKIDYILPYVANTAESSPVLAEAVRLLNLTEQLWLQRSPSPPAPSFRPQCLRIFKGHTYWVTSVCVSPDGRCAVSGSWDKTLRVWNLETGECLRILEGHTAGVNSVDVLPDGQHAISASKDKTLRLWDLSSGICLVVLKGHTDSVVKVSVSFDGGYAISASADKTLRLWDLEKRHCKLVFDGLGSTSTPVKFGGGRYFFDGFCSGFHGLCITPDGFMALTGSADGILRVWDLQSGYCLSTLEGHEEAVLCVCISPDGSCAISGSRDRGKGRNLSLWDVENRRCLRALTYGGEVNALCVSPDSKTVLAGTDSILRVLDLNTGVCLRTFEGHQKKVTDIRITPDGRHAVSASEDETFRLWDLESSTRSDIFKKPWVEIFAVALSSDGRRAVSSILDKSLCIWDLKTGVCLFNLQVDEEVRKVFISPDGRYAVSGSEYTLCVWDIVTGQCLRTLEGHNGSIKSICVSPDWRRVVSGSSDRTLRVWDLETGICLRTLQGHTTGVYSICVSPDGQCAVSGSRDGTLCVWDLETGQCLRTLEGHTDFVESICVNPDGQSVVSGSWDQTVRVWYLETGKCVHTLEGHTDCVYSVCVTPDGQSVVSGSRDRTLRVWDLGTGQCLRTLEGHTDWVESVCVSSDGKYIVSGSSDRTLRVWNLETGICLAMYHARGLVLSFSVSLKGDHIVCGTSDGQMHFLRPVNFPPSGSPIITVVQLWHFGEGNQPGQRDDHLTVECPWCGRRFPVRDGQLGQQIACPLDGCGGEMQLNPFVAGGLE